MSPDYYNMRDALSRVFGPETLSAISKTERDLLVMDALSLWRDELDGDDPTNVIPDDELMREAAEILSYRIGGAKNVKHYVKSLPDTTEK